MVRLPVTHWSFEITSRHRGSLAPLSLNGQRRRAATDLRASEGLTTEICQALTAASNYIGAAQLLISSSDGALFRAAMDNLDKAGDQTIRAGAIAHRLRDQLDRQEVRPAPSSA